MVEAFEESAPVADVEYQEVDKSQFEPAPLADEEVNSLAEELDNLAEPYIEEKMEGQAKGQQDKEVDIEQFASEEQVKEEFEGVIEEEFQGKGVDIEQEFQGKGEFIEEEFQGKGEQYDI